MKVTSFTIFNQVTRALQQRLRDMAVYSDRLTSGKRINKPSDDVSGMMKAMDYKVSINEIDQYRKNIDDADSHLGLTDTIMGSVSTSMIRARELALQASTGTLTAEDRAAIAVEIDNLKDEVLRLSQTKFRDRYIFSGYKTDTAPFDDAFDYQGDSGEIEVLINRNSTMAVNVSGEEAFSSGGKTFFESLDDLYNALVDPDGQVAQAGAQAALSEIDDALTQVSNVRATAGARMNRLEDLRNSLDDRNLSLNTLLSNTQDTDIAQTISELAKIEVALQSLRASGSKVISQSLLDFLG
ncbi:MAG: flagellar hook-associated protein 3 [Nitrospiraceae bacterium]|nr:MAG: flagellar hook-associated protein 3 [Nitrospiraceae bacterium]